MFPSKDRSKLPRARLDKTGNDDENGETAESTAETQATLLTGLARLFICATGGCTNPLVASERIQRQPVDGRGNRNGIDTKMNAGMNEAAELPAKIQENLEELEILASLAH
jgi:hypothetical protein